MSKEVFVYILTNKKKGTLYVGVTSNLLKRLYEHKVNLHNNSFSNKYSLHKLVWYIVGNDINGAIDLEKKIKNRNRAWKIALIEKTNPKWCDLSLKLLNL